MKSSIPEIYIARKLGQGKSMKYVLASLRPSAILMLISALLVFSLSFITSMTDALDMMMRYLGSGDLRVEGVFDDGAFGEELFFVKETEALAMSADGTSAFVVKSVDFDSYFIDERKELLRLSYGERNVLNPVAISARIAEALCVSPGDRFSLMLYEEDKGRTRPLLVTVAAVFDSGYREFDESYVYLDNMDISGRSYTEIVLDAGVDLEQRRLEIAGEGYSVKDYISLNSALYENVRFSSAVLYGVFALLSVLAAFFSSNIAYEYTERDRKDIGTLRLLGLEGSRIGTIYFRMTALSVLAALVSGFVLGVLASLSIPSLLSFLEKMDYAALGAYLTSFEVKIPFGLVSAMLALLFAVSSVSLRISLSHLERANVLEVVGS